MEQRLRRPCRRRRPARWAATTVLPVPTSPRTQVVRRARAPPARARTSSRAAACSSVSSQGQRRRPARATRGPSVTWRTGSRPRGALAGAAAMSRNSSRHEQLLVREAPARLGRLLHGCAGSRWTRAPSAALHEPILRAQAPAAAGRCRRPAVMRKRVAHQAAAPTPCRQLLGGGVHGDDHARRRALGALAHRLDGRGSSCA